MKIFEKCVWTTDRPRSRDDLDLNYSHNFIYSISCLHLPLFRSQAAIVFKTSIVFTFSQVKDYVSKIDLAVKYVKVIVGSSFEQTMTGWGPQCYIPSFLEISPPVLEKKIFEGFLPWRPGHVTKIP